MHREAITYRDVFFPLGGNVRSGYYFPGGGSQKLYPAQVGSALADSCLWHDRISPKSACAARERIRDEHHENQRDLQIPFCIVFLKFLWFLAVDVKEIHERIAHPERLEEI